MSISLVYVLKVDINKETERITNKKKEKIDPDEVIVGLSMKIETLINAFEMPVLNKWEDFKLTLETYELTKHPHAFLLTIEISPFTDSDMERAGGDYFEYEGDKFTLESAFGYTFRFS
jgi:hypothetical protein